MSYVTQKYTNNTAVETRRHISESLRVKEREKVRGQREYRRGEKKKIIFLLFYKDLFFRYQHYALEVRATSTVNVCPPWHRVIHIISTLLLQKGDTGA
jgi:hypothetical protein